MVNRATMKAGKQSAVDLIRCSLEEDIYQGVLPPGAAIDEAALMKKFAVSRTPVRTSLSQLASQGLIEIVPRSGTYVLSMTPRELVCMLEVLGELEGANAKFAARRMASEARTHLKTFHEKGAEISESGNAESYESYNENLHDLIYDASLNPYLTQQILKIRRRTRVYRRGLFQRPGRIKASYSEHQKFVDAIIAGAEEQARYYMVEHISHSGGDFLELLAEMPHQ